MFGIEMEPATLVALISGILAIIGLLVGGKYGLAMNVAVAALELATHTVVSIVDKVVTEEEFSKWEELKQVLLDALAEFKKSPTKVKKANLEALLSEAKTFKK